MDRRAWWATIHEVEKEQDMTEHEGKKCFKFKKIRIFPAIPIHTIAQSNQRVNNGKVAILANK